MTQAAAARELGIHKSTVTRWVQTHPALVGDDGMVDLAELRSHRDAVVNPKLRTRNGGAAAASGESGGGTASAPVAPNMNDHRTRGEYVKAVTAELDLAEKLKQTLRRDDVARAVASAGDVLKRTAASLAKDRAEQLARIDEPRAMERALDDLMREMLEKGATALMLALASGPDATEEESGRDAA